MTPEKLISLAAAKALSYDYIGGGGRPEWTSQEAGMALAGLPEDIRRYAVTAFCYRWAGDESLKSQLYGFLFNEATKMAIREGWPSRVQGQRYLDKLVRMAILEERYWFVVTKGQLWHLLMEVDQVVWERRLSRKYEGIRDVLERWCAIARAHVHARMVNDEHELSTACR